MARAHGRILCSILEDEDFQELSESGQRLYMILLAQPQLTTAGVLDLTVKRWARACKATTPDDITKALHELDERRYVLVDEETEECLIRTYIRNDGIAKQPQMLSNALRVARNVLSPRLRFELAVELRRLGREDATRVADEISPPEAGPPDRPGTSTATTRSPIQAHRSLTAGSDQSASSLTAGSPIQADGSLSAACAEVGGEGGKGLGGLVPVDINLSSRSKNSCAPSSASDLEVACQGELPLIEPPGPSEAVVPISRKADETFTRFWAAYPRKKSKPAARTAWDKAIKRADPEALIGAAQRLADSKPDLKYTPHPSTWLNNDRWNDEPDPVNSGGYQGYQEPTDPSVYLGGLLS